LVVGKLQGQTTVTIDTSGKWWVGTEPADVREYLEAYTEDSYEADEIRMAKCACGSQVFSLEFDSGEAKRVCIQCGKPHYICDSEKYWDEAEAKLLRCTECKSEEFNVGVGFSLYEEDDGVRWLYVGERCAQCGTLGCCADWKVGQGPAGSIMDKA